MISSLLREIYLFIIMWPFWTSFGPTTEHRWSNVGVAITNTHACSSLQCLYTQCWCGLYCTIALARMHVLLKHHCMVCKANRYKVASVGTGPNQCFLLAYHITGVDLFRSVQFMCCEQGFILLARSRICTGTQCRLLLYCLQRRRLKTQVRKTKVPEDGICKYGIRKYEYARVKNASTENASTNVQRFKT